jgi:hypothetical protein
LNEISFQPDSKPIYSPILLPSDVIGGTIQNFTWNPAIPNRFAYLDGNGSVSCFELDQMSKKIKLLGKSNTDNNSSSSKFNRFQSI